MTARHVSASLRPVLRLPVLSFLLLLGLTSAPPARAEERPPEPSLVAPSAPSPVLPDDAARLAEPEIPRSEPPELAAEEFSLGWTLVRTLIALAMVVALAYLMLNVGLRRLMGIRAPVGTSVVTVLERVALDQKRSLFVVEAGGEVLLIGGGDSALSLIAKLDRAEVAKLRSTPPAPLQLSPFLRKLLGRKETPPPPAPDPGRNP